MKNFLSVLAILSITIVSCGKQSPEEFNHKAKDLAMLVYSQKDYFEGHAAEIKANNIRKKLDDIIKEIDGLNPPAEFESSKTALKDYASYWGVYVMEVDLGTYKYDSTANAVWRDELSKKEDVLRKKKLLPTN